MTLCVESLWYLDTAGYTVRTRLALKPTPLACHLVSCLHSKLTGSPNASRLESCGCGLHTGRAPPARPGKMEKPPQEDRGRVLWAECFKHIPCPDRCGSVARALSRKAKGHVFDSRSGHMPGLRPNPGATEPCFSPSLSPSIPLSLRINK